MGNIILSDDAVAMVEMLLSMRGREGETVESLANEMVRVAYGRMGALATYAAKREKAKPQAFTIKPVEAKAEPKAEPKAKAEPRARKVKVSDKASK